MLSWKEYLKGGVVRKTTQNIGLIKTLINMAKIRIEVESKLKLDEHSASVIFTNYYDSLREICEAVALSKGYKIYSHEALGLFLREILSEEAIFQKFNRFRIMRNGVQYYGKNIPLEEVKQGIIDINNIISKLKSKYLKNF